MKLALIVNPVASSVSGRSRIVIQKALGADHELVVSETTRSGHAIRMAHQAAREGADVIVTLGGDGTVNEAANGLLTRTNEPNHCALAPLPGGSTNVFARAIGYPNDPLEATGVLLEGLEQGSIRNAPVGMANGRAFLFHVGVGFDAAVVTRVEKRSPLKRWMGHPWFVASTLAALASPATAKLNFTIKTDNGRCRENAQMAVALNVNPYTYLGNRPLDLAPEASLDSPLSIVALESVRLGGIVPAVLQALSRSDGLPNRGDMTHWRDVMGATVSSQGAFPYQLDGEPQKPVTELRLEHRPDAVRLVVPT